MVCDVPCKLGEVIYFPVANCAVPIRLLVTKFELVNECVTTAENVRNKRKYYFHNSDFGKTVFLNNSDAMERLNKLREVK